MKKIMVLLSLLFAVAEVMSQNSSWYIGPRVGVSVATVTNPGTIGSFGENYYKAGFTGGVYGEFKYKHFALELDVLYSSQGTSIPEMSDHFSDDYLLLPLKIKFYIPHTGGLNLFVGPQLDLLLSDKIRSLTFNNGVPRDYKKATVSLTAGVGYRFKFGLELTANYNYGLQNLDNVFPDEPYRNSVFQFTVRYDVFRFGAK